jgi:hypothetical protein
MRAVAVTQGRASPQFYLPPFSSGSTGAIQSPLRCGLENVTRDCCLKWGSRLAKEPLLG